MASALPQPSRQSTSTPTGSVASLSSTSKLKPSQLASDARRVSSSSPSKLRSPTRPSLGGGVQSNSTSSVSSLRSTSGTFATGGAEKGLRRTVSIASFPQPPKANSRLSTASAASSTSQTPRGSPDLVRSATGTARKKSRLSSTANSNRGSKASSLHANNGIDGKTVQNLAGIKDSEGLTSVSSPPQSRSSSAQGSYSTSATTFDDTEDVGADSTAAGKKGPKPKEAKGNVIVSVRVRPDNGAPEGSRADGEWMVDGRRSLIAFKGKESYDYFYDNVFTTHDNNSRVYDSSAKRLVRRVMEGYHGTVFAYGMTGTGKTFSMQGTASSPGVIPLAITDIFSYIRETPHREFLLRVSYLEIYNERIHDLLSASTATGPGPAPQEEIKLREDSKRGVYATPLKEEIVQSPTQLLRVIARGDHARRTGSTQFNARSSRSHAVVQIVVESRERAPGGNSSQDKRAAVIPGGVRVSTLSLIDLAGSERAAENKERRTEGAHINKSLLTLGTVIARLSESKEKAANSTDKEGKHLPYRDSKLTRLLQPALSGNSLVSILCTIQTGSSGSAAPANTHTNETLNTLKFAARAKNNIVSHAKRAEEAFGGGNGDAGSRVLLERYRVEIQTLRAQLENQTKVQAENETRIEEERIEKEQEARHEEQMLEMQLARTALKERIEHLNRLILSSKSTGVNSSSATAALEKLSRTSANLESGTRSLRSSASQSTLGASSLRRTVSQYSLNSGDRSSVYQLQRASLVPEDDDDTIGEYGDGNASLQMQVTALQADLADKNRYISTLERRLLQARRSSHSRMSMGLSQHKNNEDVDVAALLRERDMEITELRIQLDDKDRMLTALRSAARQRDIAQMPMEAAGSDKQAGQRNSEGNSSLLASTAVPDPTSPADPTTPAYPLTTVTPSLTLYIAHWWLTRGPVAADITPFLSPDVKNIPSHHVIVYPNALKLAPHRPRWRIRGCALHSRSLLVPPLGLPNKTQSAILTHPTLQWLH
ncbi:Kinesin-related protein 4 [Talaromyces islandicus]|uniref:Kinesin-like protein n=1 Tax=Talaromyces islandicus TaxID=28573 RepID=A0A0U1M2N7_TALIS|nr:Kinesin-related protein 4 [Talaromyces islandicus]